MSERVFHLVPSILKQLDSLKIRSFPKYKCIIKNVTTLDDMKMIRQMQVEAFGTELINSNPDWSKSKAWKIAQDNEFSFRIALDDKQNPLGFYLQFFIKSTTYQHLKDGTLLEQEIDNFHCSPLSSKDNVYLHLPDIYIKPSTSHLITHLLLMDMKHLHTCFLKEGIHVKTVSAIAVSPENEKMLSRLGLKQTQIFKPLKNGYRPKFFEISAEDYRRERLHTLPIFGTNQDKHHP